MQNNIRFQKRPNCKTYFIRIDVFKLTLRYAESRIYPNITNIYSRYSFIFLMTS